MTDPDDRAGHNMSWRAGVALAVSFAAFVWSIIEMVAVIVYLCMWELGEVAQEGLFALLSAGVAVGAGLVADHYDSKANPKPEPTMWDRWDEIITQGGYDAVLRHLAPSMRFEFSAAGQPCPSRPATGTHHWYRNTDYSKGGAFKNHECLSCKITTAEFPDVIDRLIAEKDVADKKRMAEQKRAAFEREAARKIDRKLYSDGGPVVEIMAWNSDKPVATYRPEQERMTMADLQAELDKLSRQVDKAYLYR